MYHDGTNGYLTLSSGILYVAPPASSYMQLGGELYQANVVSSGSTPASQWIEQISTSALGSGNYSMIEQDIQKDQAAVATANGIFGNITGDYNWGIHENIGSAADNAWAYVAGIHGTNSRGFVMDIDTSDTNSGMQIYKNVTGNTSPFQIRTDEDPISGTTATTFNGKALEVYNLGNLKASISGDGAIASSSTITSSRTSDLGWSVVSATNQACNTTCTSACVFGQETTSKAILACTDATADTCVCAGSS